MNIKLVAIYFTLFCTISYSQQRDISIWPYGGVPQVNRPQVYDFALERSTFPLLFLSASFDDIAFMSNIGFTQSIFKGNSSFKKTKFEKLARFDKVIFDSVAIFQDAEFNEAIFESVQFKNKADFFRAKFNGPAYFFAKFDSTARFRVAKFDSSVDFLNANFMGSAFFGDGECRGRASFRHAIFHQKADFNSYRFISTVDFEASGVLGETKFYNAKFYNDIDFKNAFLNGKVDFSLARINGRINFTNAVFNSEINFRDAIFAEKSDYVNFNSARIIDTLFIGTIKWDNPQKFDLRLARLMPSGQYEHSIHTNSKNLNHFNLQKIAVFGPGAKIVLYGPVEIKILYDQIPFIALPPKMDYFTKKFIIDHTKQASFASDDFKKERLELDYIFSKSTMYQKPTAAYENYSVLHPKTWLRFIYNLTMGLGYRPFRLALCALIAIIAFSIYYFCRFPYQINTFINKNHEKSSSRNLRSHPRSFGTLINCFYFSTMVLLSLRLKGTILTQFNDDEKKAIIFEWVIGFVFILAFLLWSKAGVIKELKDNLPI